MRAGLMRASLGHRRWVICLPSAGLTTTKRRSYLKPLEVISAFSTSMPAHDLTGYSRRLTTIRRGPDSLCTSCLAATPTARPPKRASDSPIHTAFLLSGSFSLIKSLNKSEIDFIIEQELFEKKKRVRSTKEADFLKNKKTD